MGDRAHSKTDNKNVITSFSAGWLFVRQPVRKGNRAQTQTTLVAVTVATSPPVMAHHRRSLQTRTCEPGRRVPPGRRCCGRLRGSISEAVLSPSRKWVLDDERGTTHPGVVLVPTASLPRRSPPAPRVPLRVGRLPTPGRELLGTRAHKRDDRRGRLVVALRFSLSCEQCGSGTSTRGVGNPASSAHRRQEFAQEGSFAALGMPQKTDEVEGASVGGCDSPHPRGV